MSIRRLTLTAATVCMLTLIVAGCTGRGDETKLALKVAIEPEHGVPGRTLAPSYYRGDQDDRFRLVVTAEQEGFCYVLNRGSSGRFVMVYPNRDAGITNNRLTPGEPTRIPSEGAGNWLGYGDGAGVENMTFFFAVDRIDALEELFGDGATDPDRVQETLATLEKTVNPEAKLAATTSEDALALTFTSPQAGAFLKADVPLHHD